MSEVYLSLNHLFLLVPPILLLESFFAGSEIAFLSADKVELQNEVKKGNRSAKLALDLANHPERVLSTTLLMTALCVIGTSSLIAIYFHQYNHPKASIFAVLVTSPLVVLFGELIPKTVYQRYANSLAPVIALPLTVAFYVFYPFTKILSIYTTRLSRLVRPIEALLTGRRKTTREELRSMLSYGKKESELDPTEKQMIKRIFDFKDSEAKNALIPLVQVIGIEKNSTIGQALEMFLKHRHSRMPVYSERIDNIVGVIENRKFLGKTKLDSPIEPLIEPAHYAAEAQSLRDLLVDMHNEQNEMTIVVDEYGGAVGILTYEDIIEEIVGEINDEDDNESLSYRVLTDGTWLIKARMEIQEINEKLSLSIPQGDYETLSGFLLQQFGRIPLPRDDLYFDTPSGSLRFTIRSATDRYIETVVVEKMS